MTTRTAFTKSAARQALIALGFTFHMSSATWRHADGTVGRLRLTPADYATPEADAYSRAVLATPTVLVTGCTQHPNGGTCPHAGPEVPVLG